MRTKEKQPKILKGWRRLKPEEEIRAGDRWWFQHQWVEVSASVEQKVQQSVYPFIRRAARPGQ